MRQSSTITIFDLGVHPELAALEILDAALAAAKLAVIAVHAELSDLDCDELLPDLEAFAADQVLTTASALQRAIAAYRTASTAGTYRRRSHQPDPADPPF